LHYPIITTKPQIVHLWFDNDDLRGDDQKNSIQCEDEDGNLLIMVIASVPPLCTCVPSDGTERVKLHSKFVISNKKVRRKWTLFLSQTQ
jgi:hypothetical protein